ncbi:MAG: cob(I)yrinic acid a,c-diamide adenosyltransferase [Anaerolineae bacterium]
MNTTHSGEPGTAFGRLQIYTGAGKGKTTAALGLALRAAGWGYASFIGQFMKKQDTGELHSVARLEPLITIEQFGQPSFVLQGGPSEADLAMTRAGLRRIAEVLAGSAYQIVVMDEICVALHLKLTTPEEVMSLIRTRPAQVELVLTGQGAPPELLEVADLVTEMVLIKHPYQQGVPARRGIEF